MLEKKFGVLHVNMLKVHIQESNQQAKEVRE